MTVVVKSIGKDDSVLLDDGITRIRFIKKTGVTLSGSRGYKNIVIIQRDGDIGKIEVLKEGERDECSTGHRDSTT